MLKYNFSIIDKGVLDFNHTKHDMTLDYQQQNNLEKRKINTGCIRNWLKYQILECQRYPTY